MWLDPSVAVEVSLHVAVHKESLTTHIAGIPHVTCIMVSMFLDLSVFDTIQVPHLLNLCAFGNALSSAAFSHIPTHIQGIHTGTYKNMKLLESWELEPEAQKPR